MGSRRPAGRLRHRGRAVHLGCTPTRRAPVPASAHIYGPKHVVGQRVEASLRPLLDKGGRHGRARRVPASQHRRSEHRAATRWVAVDRTFTDKDTNRPALAEALRYLRDGDTFVIHSMDHLARDLEDLRRTVRELTARGVRVEFVKEGMLHRRRLPHEHVAPVAARCRRGVRAVPDPGTTAGGYRDHPCEGCARGARRSSLRTRRRICGHGSPWANLRRSSPRNTGSAGSPSTTTGAAPLRETGNRGPDSRSGADRAVAGDHSS